MRLLFKDQLYVWLQKSRGAESLVDRRGEMCFWCEQPGYCSYENCHITPIPLSVCPRRHSKNVVHISELIYHNDSAAVFQTSLSSVFQLTMVKFLNTNIRNEKTTTMISKEPILDKFVPYSKWSSHLIQNGFSFSLSGLVLNLSN